MIWFSKWEYPISSLSHMMQSFIVRFLSLQLSPIVTFGPMVQFSMETFFPMMHGGNQPGIVNGIPLVDAARLTLLSSGRSPARAGGGLSRHEAVASPHGFPA